MKCKSLFRVSVLGVILVLALISWCGFSDEEPKKTSVNDVVVVYAPFYRNPSQRLTQDMTATAIFKAVDFLLESQNENGSWSDGGETNLCSSLAYLALLSVGDLPFASTNMEMAARWLDQHGVSGEKLQSPLLCEVASRQIQTLKRQHRFSNAQLIGLEKCFRTSNLTRIESSEIIDIYEEEQDTSFRNLLDTFWDLPSIGNGVDTAMPSSRKNMKKSLLAHQNDDGSFGPIAGHHHILDTSLGILALMTFHPVFYVIEQDNRTDGHPKNSNLSGSPLELL